MDILTQKKNLRREAKAYRNSLSENERLDKSIDIRNNLKNIPEFRDTENILMYASLQGEVDTLSLIHELLNEGNKKAYCPVVKGDEMEFHRILSLNDLQEGNFHVLEPQGTEDTLLTVEKSIPYCMIMPGLMFDKKGNRLGYGKGYYDKYLAKMPENTNLTTIALSYEAMVKDELPAEETDYCADYIVTEKQIYFCLNK